MKDKLTAGILAILLGSLGIHHFYLGNTPIGIVYLGTWMLLFILGWVLCFIPWFIMPVLSIVSIVEGIMFLTMDDEKFNQKYNTPKTF
ncbi:MAG: TM2 domain-containing protein [Bacteroidaceae bacterium]|nr:TM2 domain-containing protein [Bacteroidaceae bacterium]